MGGCHTKLAPPLAAEKTVRFPAGHDSIGQ